MSASAIATRTTRPPAIVHDIERTPPLRCVACGFRAHAEWPHRPVDSTMICRGPWVGPDLPTVEIHLEALPR